MIGWWSFTHTWLVTKPLHGCNSVGFYQVRLQQYFTKNLSFLQLHHAQYPVKTAWSTINVMELHWCRYVWPMIWSFFTILNTQPCRQHYSWEGRGWGWRRVGEVHTEDWGGQTQSFSSSKDTGEEMMFWARVTKCLFWDEARNQWKNGEWNTTQQCAIIPSCWLFPSFLPSFTCGWDLLLS